MYFFVSVALVFSFAVNAGRTAEGTFFYDAQNEWTGVCTSGMRQSPVDIVTSNVVANSTLTELTFNGGWQAQTSGMFENTGTTVKFTPASTTSTNFVNFLGTYELQQFHMHWGATEGTGSEHRVNGDQAEVELHFVHYRRGVTNQGQGDFAAVLAVFADVADVPISGVWAQLDTTAIQSNTSSPVSVSGLVLNNLLPEGRGYYYYPGSLTTPGCDEIVQWFVLKNRITVPMAFVQQLRMVEQANGEPLTFNYRNLQALNGRTVQTASQSFNKPALLVLLITVFLTVFM